VAGGIGVRFFDKRAAIVLFLAILIKSSIRGVSSGIVIDHLARKGKLYRPAGSECFKAPRQGKKKVRPLASKVTFRVQRREHRARAQSL
jgi:hypothetical protein